MIKMPITKIRKSMSYERGQLDWKNIYTTNCYAYALHLDIAQDDICNYAYNLGQIAKMNDNDENPSECTSNLYNSKDFEFALLSDFEALGLEYLESNIKEFYPNDLDTYPGRSFDILYFINTRDHFFDDFHFARYGKDGKLYHKWGFVFPPEETTIEKIESDGYEFVKRYRLFLSRGPKNRR